jgi:hypothetical protein
VSDPDSLFAQLEAQRGRSLPPVERWNPPRSGESGMRIAVDGTWFYRGSEIRRPNMVRLFSTVLRRDPDGYVLVTPAERLSIVVDDAPFVAVDFEAQGSGRAQRLVFLTNVGDVVEASADRPLSLRGSQPSPRPYVLVRNRLDALVSRPAYYRLAELAREGPTGRLGVWSDGAFFELELGG